MVAALETTTFANGVNPQKPVSILGIAYLSVEGAVTVPRYEILLRRDITTIVMRMKSFWV